MKHAAKIQRKKTGSQQIADFLQVMQILVVFGN